MIMIKVYKPFTPSEYVDSNYYKVISIKMSCGGGMGGASWYEYIKADTPQKMKEIYSAITKGGIIKVVDYLGNTKYINTNYVVMTQEQSIYELTIENKGNTYYEIIEGGKYIFRYLINERKTKEIKNINTFEYTFEYGNNEESIGKLLFREPIKE